MGILDVMVTLWPSFPHFGKFADDERLSGIRLNSAMINNPELENELGLIKSSSHKVPLYFDVKGRQLRVKEVHLNPDYLDITLNHPVRTETPMVVLFKAGEDQAVLARVEEEGRRLIFDGGPGYMVDVGESLHIRHPSFEVLGPVFLEEELLKIEKVVAAGFDKYYLSYVETQREVDEFLELVGKDSEVLLKIETKKGLEYAVREFKKKDNLFLVAARGDLYVEVDRPHEIVDAMRLLIKADPEAYVGSRLLLSIVDSPVPSCAGFSDLAWLCDIGYKNFLLCDEICLKDELLSVAVNVFDDFRHAYKGGANVRLEPVTA